MAALRHAWINSGFSRQFNCFLCKFPQFLSYSTGSRMSFLLESPQSCIKLYSSTCTHSSFPQSLEKKLRNFTLGPIVFKDFNSRGVHTTEILPEFVSEQVSIQNESIKDIESFDECLEKVKAKTGVLIKSIKSDKENSDEKRQWSVLIGGSRQDVQKAVSFLKSLLTPEPQKQRLMTGATQAHKTKGRHFGDKEKPIWAYYRRNFKGQKPPMRTRKRCIRGNGEKQTVSGNPCPLCRLYLGSGYELDYKDIDLLSQFISPHNGEVFEASKTGLCRVQQGKLVGAIETAKDYGLFPYSIPGPRSLERPAQVAQIPRNVRLK